MTPTEFKEWAHAIREALQEFLPNRDSWIWTNLLTGCAALMALAAVEPKVFPPGWADQIMHWGGVAGMVAAKMGWSWAGSPEPRTVYLPPPQPMPPNVAVVPAASVTKDGGQ